MLATPLNFVPNAFIKIVAHHKERRYNEGDVSCLLKLASKRVGHYERDECCYNPPDNCLRECSLESVHTS